MVLSMLLFYVAVYGSSMVLSCGLMVETKE